MQTSVSQAVQVQFRTLRGVASQAAAPCIAGHVSSAHRMTVMEFLSVLQGC